MDIEKNEEVSTDEPASLRTELESAFNEVAPDASADTSPGVEASGESEAKAPFDRPRRPDGTFAKKEADPSGHGASDGEAGAKATGAPPEVAPVAQPVAAPPAAEPVKPPQSWKPAAREHWAMLPDHVKQEILRREGETSRVLNETTEARRFRETFQQSIAPYEAMLRSEGADPLAAVQSLLETAQQLRSAAPQQKAALVAQIVRGYGVPIEALDAALAGQPYRGPAQGPVMDPRVDQLFAQIEQAKAQRAQAEAAAADSAVQEFGANKEFFDDVREDMADIIEIAEKRGQKIDLEVAYKRALAMNDEISAVLRQRQEAKGAATAKAATQRSKAAASSVRSSSPPLKGGAPGESLRDALADAWEEAAG